jgi:NAD(P)H-flavin reductase
MESLYDTASQIGYELQEVNPLFPYLAQRQNKSCSKIKDRCFSVSPKKRRPKAVSREYNKGQYNKKDLDEVKLSIRATAFLNRTHSTEKLKELAKGLIEPALHGSLAGLLKKDVSEIISDNIANQKAYHKVCINFIRPILSKDSYKIVPDVSSNIAKGVGFVAANKDGNKILFCFYDPKKEKILKNIADSVCLDDKLEFRVVCYLIFHDKGLMQSCRQVNWADNWPRGFFICFEDLKKKATEVDGSNFGHLGSISSETESNIDPKHTVKHFKAKVIKNIAIGNDIDPKHYKMEFSAPDLQRVVPGQFVMIDTLPYSQRKKKDRYKKKTFAIGAQEGGLQKGGKQKSLNKSRIELKSASYLKRPFGIQRAYYKHFKWGYLKNLKLPRHLSPITHTVFPHRFEVFYKIIEDGVGTNELKRIQPDQEIQMLGPLGSVTDVSKWLSDDISEVHLIGGGVGMAPLVFFGQALKFYSFKLKAFIGIDRIESLKEAQYG